jgi:hypothetical protein
MFHFAMDTIAKALFIYIGYYGFRTLAWIMLN